MLFGSFMINGKPALFGSALFVDGITLPVTATNGLQLYNTADQTTNYERLEMLYSANEAFVRTVTGGAGTGRVLTLAGGQSNGSLNASMVVLNGTAQGITFYAFADRSSKTNGTTNGTASKFSFIPCANTATAGNVVGFSIAPAYNQTSGTAANTDLLINRTETAVGSGAQLFFDAQVGGTSKGSLSNVGNLTLAGYAAIGANAAYYFTGKSRISSASDGVLMLANNGGTDFSRLQFGGTTSSFPALGRTGGGLQVRLADDSGFSYIIASSFFLSGATVRLTSGSGSPEGVVAASVGSLYSRTDGGASTSLYVKESGTGNTGWVAK